MSDTEMLEIPESHAGRLQQLREDPEFEADIDSELVKMLCQSIDDTYREQYL